MNLEVEKTESLSGTFHLHIGAFSLWWVLVSPIVTKTIVEPAHYCLDNCPPSNNDKKLSVLACLSQIFRPNISQTIAAKNLFEESLSRPIQLWAKTGSTMHFTVWIITYLVIMIKSKISLWMIIMFLKTQGLRISNQCSEISWRMKYLRDWRRG